MVVLVTSENRRSVRLMAELSTKRGRRTTETQSGPPSQKVPSYRMWFWLGGDCLLMVARWGAACGLRPRLPVITSSYTRSPSTSELLPRTAGLRKGTFAGSRLFLCAANHNQPRRAKKVANDTETSYNAFRHKTPRHREKAGDCFRARLA